MRSVKQSQVECVAKIIDTCLDEGETADVEMLF